PNCPFRRRTAQTRQEAPILDSSRRDSECFNLSSMTLDVWLVARLALELDERLPGARAQSIRNEPAWPCACGAPASSRYEASRLDSSWRVTGAADRWRSSRRSRPKARY